MNEVVLLSSRMAKRFVPVQDPVEIELDGEKIVAERGEPLVHSLIAAGKLALARSPKLHRPHGPTCLRGACDGCLARVDGEPNVMTCMVRARGGERIETQNVLGSRRFDLLRTTDWFFPEGMDHHRFLAGVPAASSIMQEIARRVAGLGKLPERELKGEAALRREVEFLIVGAGASGLRVASRLAEAGREVLVVDDGAAPGGSLRARGLEVAREFVEEALGAGAEIATQTTVAGFYEGEALLATKTQATLVDARVKVLATGAHDGVLAFENNDLPGVFSTRAACLLANSGIAIGERIALVGDGPYTEALLDKLANVAELVRVPPGADFGARGRLKVSAIVIEGARQAVDAIAVEAPGAPAFELASQAGAEVELDLSRGGYVPIVDTRGRAAEGLYCAGELAGVGSELAAIVDQAERVAEACLGLG